MNAKLTVTIVIPGSTMMSNKEAELDKKENYNTESVFLEWREDKKVCKGRMFYQTRKCIPATQVVNMPDEAYYYMTSGEKPEWFNSVKDWVRLSKEQRLELHLKKLCQALGGKSFTYEVFPD